MWRTPYPPPGGGGGCPIRQLLGAADVKRHTPPHSATPTAGLRERGNDTSRSTGRSGRQNAATRRNMRRGERVTVRGLVKKQQPDGMSHTGVQRQIKVCVHKMGLKLPDLLMNFIFRSRKSFLMWGGGGGVGGGWPGPRTTPPPPGVTKQWPGLNLHPRHSQRDSLSSVQGRRQHSVGRTPWPSQRQHLR